MPSVQTHWKQQVVNRQEEPCHDWWKWLGRNNQYAEEEALVRTVDDTVWHCDPLSVGWWAPTPSVRICAQAEIGDCPPVLTKAGTRNTRNHVRNKQWLHNWIIGLCMEPTSIVQVLRKPGNLSSSSPEFFKKRIAVKVWEEEVRNQHDDKSFSPFSQMMLLLPWSSE